MGLFVKFEGVGSVRGLEEGSEKLIARKLDVTREALKAIAAFRPENVRHWEDSPGEQLGGKLLGTQDWEDGYALDISTQVRWNSVLQVNGDWRTGKGRVPANALVCFDPGWRAMRHDLHIDVEPGEYQDVTDVLFEKTDGWRNVDNLMTRLMEVRSAGMRVSSLCLSGDTPEDFPESLAALYSRDKLLHWRFARSLLDRGNPGDEGAQHHRRRGPRQLATYRDDTVYRILEDGITYRYGERHGLIDSASVVKSSGSVKLIGKEKLGVGAYIQGLSKLLMKGVSRLDEPEQVRRRVHEAFGARQSKLHE